MSHEDMLRRVPPHSLQAEQSVIGGVLICPELYEPVADILAADDFYREPHRILWVGIQGLAEARKPIDAILLADALRPHLEAIGG